jgi:hypothetical protein
LRRRRRARGRLTAAGDREQRDREDDANGTERPGGRRTGYLHGFAPGRVVAADLERKWNEHGDLVNTLAGAVGGSVAEPHAA